MVAMSKAEFVVLMIIVSAVFLFFAYLGIGCENTKVCFIEYMDGTSEAVECRIVTEDHPLFGSPHVLKIYQKDGMSQTKSLATIKRWRVEEKVNP